MLRKGAIWPTVLPMKAAPIVVLAAVLLGASVAAFAARPAMSFTSAEQPPGFVYARDGQELVVVLEGGGQEPVEWDLSDTLRGDASRFIESIEPIAVRTLFVGICCEPADGRQLIVDRVNGTVEIFPFTVRFPSTRDGGLRYVSGGSSVALNDLGSVLAYESGVGVIAPGSTLLSREDGAAFRPVLLPQERIVVLDVVQGEERLVLVDRSGAALATASLDATELREIGLFDYDDRNNAVLAVVGEDSLVALDAASLVELARWQIDPSVVSLDVRDGWVAFTRADGSLEAAPLSAPDRTRQLVSDGVDVAAWLRG